MLKKIAVTGGLSTGKSTVCSLLKAEGAFVISADEIVHQLLSPQTPIGQAVLRVFGKTILVQGRIDRKKLSEIVFSHPEKLKQLEEITHPAVFEEIEQAYERVKNDPSYSLFVAEIPLLYESKSRTQFDSVISVVASQEICKRRFIQTDLSSFPDEFEKRMARQLALKQKAIYSDYIIENEGTLEDLKQTIKTLVSKELKPR